MKKLKSFNRNHNIKWKNWRVLIEIVESEKIAQFSRNCVNWKDFIVSIEIIKVKGVSIEII